MSGKTIQITLPDGTTRDIEVPDRDASIEGEPPLDEGWARTDRVSRTTGWVSGSWWETKEKACTGPRRNYHVQESWIVRENSEVCENADAFLFYFRRP